MKIYLVVAAWDHPNASYFPLFSAYSTREAARDEVRRRMFDEEGGGFFVDWETHEIEVDP